MKTLQDDPYDLQMNEEEKPRGVFTFFSFLFFIIMFISWLFYDEAALWVIAAGVSFLSSWHNLHKRKS